MDNSSSFDGVLQQRIAAQRAQKRYRQLAVVDACASVVCKVKGRSLVNFCSNDYLGLKQHPELINAANCANSRWGVGSGASHLVSGHSLIHQQLEQRIAQWTGREKALVFSSGYMANLGVISAVLSSNDALVEDKLNHASLIDAAKLSGATLLRFNHNNMHHLEQRLIKVTHSVQAKQKPSLIMVAVDGVYSMDGDFADLPNIVKLCTQYNAQLMVDDAHGLACLGSQGLGSCDHWHMTAQQVPILMATFGKALGGFGAFVAGSELLIDSLVQFARTFTYTTAMPASVAAAALAAIDLCQKEVWRREKLNENIAYFRQQAQDNGLALMPSATAIQPIIIGDESTALSVSEYLNDLGFWVVAIRPPTVPSGKSRLRITLSTEHTFAHIDALIEALSRARDCSLNC